ncbi:hypothetical protein FBZ87_103432 [Nitrospirillum amazonense]|uniref:Uncharacterized protein n=1 Tax=Nitrospirillum amazonense TaxID=28077 RepID=A0A560K721_9PROT|nr:GNAT family N-acetyltransferase [Nitrospirillum amazonense]TWB77614.1 hypothetical protein FBZ87_103432 [Nitrospirillum amazonense]
MADGSSDWTTGLKVAVAPRIGALDAADWDRLAANDAYPGHPFTRHTFLRILEDSGSVGRKTGWLPQHLTVRDAQGRLVGAAPLYLKSHSYGEYVFDQGWANAYERAGGEYYPKLQVSVPFTPVTGPRLMADPACPDPDGVRRLMVAALRAAAVDNKLSSVHVTFPTPEDRTALTGAGWLDRHGIQYHWENRGYRDFADFLGAFSSRKRKAVRKERQAVADSGVEVLTLTGAELREEHWDAFFRLYNATSDRKWGWAYLTEDFFHRLGAEMADSVVLVMARDPARPDAKGRPSWVGGALNLMGHDTLYGRNWGSAGDYPFLHFEACYYRAIEFAIARGLKRVEAGAQGEHKVQRGYLPVTTHSAHYIVDPALRRAVADFVEREREGVAADIETLMAESPYRQGDGGSE